MNISDRVSAEILNFKSSLTGATQRTAASKFSDSVSVKDFGAVGDGVADDTLAIQAAIDASFHVTFPSGTYLISTIDLVANKRLSGSGHGSTTITSSAAIAVEFQNSTSGASAGVIIEGINFEAVNEASTTAIGPSVAANYLAYATIRDCHFSGRLEYGIKANLLNARIDSCTFGKYGTATTRMLTAIHLEGLASAESNANIISQCYISNVSDVGIYISTGWCNQISNTTIEAVGKEAIWINGGIQNTISGVYVERCYDGHTPAGNESMIRTSNNATTGDSIFSLLIEGSLFQSSAGIVGGYFIRSDGGVVANVESCAFGGLSASAISLSTNNTKILFGSTNYYPGGFTGFTLPKVVRDSDVGTQAFAEEVDASITGDVYVKTIKHSDGDNIAGGASVLGLLANRAASSAYNLIRARVDVDGTPTTVFNVAGNGTLDTGDTGDIICAGTWDGGHVVLGAYHLWVDATGDLRIKSGDPSSATDGTIVGTQS